KSWKKSLAKYQIEKISQNDQDQYKRFIENYFKAKGNADVIKLMNDFWNDEEFKTKATQIYGEEVSCMRIEQDTDNKLKFIIERKKQDYEAAFDLDFMHECNPNYLLNNAKIYNGTMNNLALAISHELCDNHGAGNELRVLVNLKGKD